MLGSVCVIRDVRQEDGTAQRIEQPAHNACILKEILDAIVSYFTACLDLGLNAVIEL